LTKNSQPFGKNFQKTLGGDFFLTHTVYTQSDAYLQISGLSKNCK